MFSASYFAKLSKLKLAINYKSDMSMSGNRNSLSKGSSVEFADFREYMPGDDLRRIDWNAYARMDRMFIKEYVEERETLVNILIDTSASMDYGERKKSELVYELAAAISYIAINNMDRVVLYDMKNMGCPFMVPGSKKSFNMILGWLEHLEFSGSLNTSECIRRFIAKGSGLTFLITDFMDEDLFENRGKLAELIHFFRYKKQNLTFLHVLAGEEVDVETNLDLTGTVNLIDIENKSKAKVTIDKDVVEKYKATLRGYSRDIEETCNKYGVNYVVCKTSDEFDKIIFNDLRVIYDI